MLVHTSDTHTRLASGSVDVGGWAELDIACLKRPSTSFGCVSEGQFSGTICLGHKRCQHFFKWRKAARTRPRPSVQRAVVMQTLLLPWSVGVLVGCVLAVALLHHRKTKKTIVIWSMFVHLGEDGVSESSR